MARSTTTKESFMQTRVGILNCEQRINTSPTTGASRRLTEESMPAPFSENSFYSDGLIALYSSMVQTGWHPPAFLMKPGIQAQTEL